MAQTAMDVPSRKRSHSGMRRISQSSSPVDEACYRTQVLQLPSHMTEDDLDDQLQREAHSLGLSLEVQQLEMEIMASSFSATTLETESNKQSSILSQSTAPTSCSSSVHRPATRSSVTSRGSPPAPSPSSMMSDTEKRRSSSFRNGIRKMAGFKKRRSIAASSSAPSGISGNIRRINEDDNVSVTSGMKSPGSAKSVGSKSSWSMPPSTAKTSVEPNALVVDPDALKRSNDCKEMLQVRQSQLAEKRRFLDFQKTLVDELRAQRDRLRASMSETQETVVHELQAKNDEAIDDLEAHQLEEEIKMQKDHSMEKQKAMMRLKHMEAYCQNPTPPPTPVDPILGRPSMETTLPGRRVTDKDYHNLAQQYRERDAMDDLHVSKINVLRGRQKKSVEAFANKKERELEKLETQQRTELQRIDKEYAAQEVNLVSALASKRSRLETRWRNQARLELTKAEKSTGLNHASLPDVVAIDEVSSTT